MINWIRKLFSTQPIVVGQPVRLDDRLEAIVSELDAQLTTRADNFTGTVDPLLFSIPLHQQSTPWMQHVNKIMVDIPHRFSYMPRSIAVVVDNDGTWNLLIGIRTKKGSSKAAQVMFADILHRTNDARV